MCRRLGCELSPAELAGLASVCPGGGPWLGGAGAGGSSRASGPVAETSAGARPAQPGGAPQGRLLRGGVPGLPCRPVSLCDI